MSLKRKTIEKGCYVSLSSREKKRIVSIAMRKANEEQINLIKEFDRKAALKKAVG